jgi:serine phosphatase RsbU (regulator of sigma subunit)
VIVPSRHLLFDPGDAVTFLTDGVIEAQSSG